MGTRTDVLKLAGAAVGVLALAVPPATVPAQPAGTGPSPTPGPLGLITFVVQGQGRLRAQLGAGTVPPTGEQVLATPGVPAQLYNDGSTVWLTPLPAAGWSFVRYLVSSGADSSQVAAVFAPAT